MPLWAGPWFWVPCVLHLVELVAVLPTLLPQSSGAVGRWAVAGAAWEEWSWGGLGLPGFRLFCSSLWENFKEQELLSILTIQSATI